MKKIRKFFITVDFLLASFQCRLFAYNKATKKFLDNLIAYTIVYGLPESCL